VQSSSPNSKEKNEAMTDVKSVTLRAGDESIEAWVAQLSKSNWRAWGAFR
jgi:hypothetical protein